MNVHYPCHSYRLTTTSGWIMLSFFPFSGRQRFKVKVTTRELKFPTRSGSTQGLACTSTRRALNPSNWIQMAVFVQGHHQLQHGSVARLMIVGGQGRSSLLRGHSDQAGGQQGVWSLTPGYTCARGHGKRSHPGSDSWFNYILSGSK